MAGVLLAVIFGAAVQTAFALVILPLGDSITDGYQVPGGYRTELYERLTNAGVSFAFVGSQTDNPTAPLTAGGQVHHEGHSGYRTDQIYNNLEGTDGTAGNNGGYWIIGGNGTGRSAISPDIVLLHIGTNDRTQGEPPSTMYAKLVILLNDLKADLPNAKVFVASLIPRTDNATYETGQQTYNAMIPALVASLGTNFHFVDLHSVVTPAEVADGNSGVHPDQAGYDAMGDAWFNALQSQQGVLAENDQSNSGDNNRDAQNSAFYFTSGQTPNPAAALQANLLTGSTVTGNVPDLGSLAGLNDLSPGAVGNGNGPTYGALTNLAYYGNGISGSSLSNGQTVTNTIRLGGLTPAATGYTLNTLSVFSGWTDDASFNDQHYTVSVSLNGTNFTTLHSVNYLPFAAAADVSTPGAQDASTLVTLTNLNANGLASGIKYVRFIFSAGTDSNNQQPEGQLIQEIEVFGTITASSSLPGQIAEIDQFNLGDDNNDATNSAFYFTSGQTVNPAAALQTNLLTGSTPAGPAPDAGTLGGLNDLNVGDGSYNSPNKMAYYGNTVNGSSLANGNSVSITIPLGGSSPSATGYTLSSLSVFDGWTDHASFCDQHYQVFVSPDGTNYLYLDTVNFMPFLAANDAGSSQDASTLVTLANLNASGLATGIKYIRFTLSAGTDGNNQPPAGQLIQEIEVFGAPTAAGDVSETDQSNIGDNSSDANNSTFYFTSGRTLNPDAALTANLLTGSAAVSGIGVDQGSLAGVNDLINGVNGNGSGTANGSLANDGYFANTLFATAGAGAINPANAGTYGVATVTVPLGGPNAAAHGYTLNKILVFEGWTDHASFSDQHYTISTSTDGINYTFLWAVDYLPFLAANDIAAAGSQDNSTLVTLTNLNAAAVKDVRWTFSAGADAQSQLQEGQLVQEVEVFGTATILPQPVVTSLRTSAGALVVSGTNGLANDNYYVLATTNLLTPVGNWPVISTNTFDAGGNFNFTNALNPSSPERYFILKLE